MKGCEDMLTWLRANWGTILVALIIAAVVIAIVYGMRRDKRAGKSSCGGNCASCGACTGGCSSCGQHVPVPTAKHRV